MYMYQRLLVPVDYSPCSEVAMQVALRLSRSFGSKITLAHVLSEEEEGANQRAKQLLKTLSNGMRNRPKLVIEPLIESIAETIVHLATHENVGMIVIGAHAHARLERKVMGSVAHDVAVLAQVPVLIVPAQIRKVGFEVRWMQAMSASRQSMNPKNKRVPISI